MDTVVKHGEHRRTSRSAEYRAWDGMLSRCRNPKCARYKYYGARGIKVCERWLKFENFLADVGRKPSPQHSLDRFPNRDGDYGPGNVRWATSSQQSRNKRSNKFFTYKGETLCLTDWARKTGVSEKTLRRRLSHQSVEQVLSAIMENSSVH